MRIKPSETFQSPVTLAQLLRDHGMDLAGGHAAVNALAANGEVEVTVMVADPDDFVRQLTKIGLTIRMTQDAASR